MSGCDPGGPSPYTVALEAAGISTIETDLGEWIIQLAHETPSHIVVPAKAGIYRVACLVAAAPLQVWPGRSTALAKATWDGVQR